MVQNYFEENSVSLNEPRPIVIQRILAFSKFYSLTKLQYEEIIARG